MHAHLLVSPDDRSELRLYQSAGQAMLMAPSTGLLHPVIDDVAILLHREDRSYELEAPAILAFLEECQANQFLADAAHKTMALLETRRGLKSFAWEDEEHWTREYAAATDAFEDPTKWNDRIWQHQQLISEAEISGTMTIVDIGCGEGHNFRNLFQQRLARDSLYIAADISFAGIKLNRKRNAWPNALYIVCSADNLPLAPSCADRICYFGILHHTKNKEKNLPAHFRILKPGGRIILSEAIERARILSDRFRQHESAHEERFDVRDLQAIIASSPEKMKLLFWKTRMSVFYTGAGRLLGGKLVRKRFVFRCLTAIDQLCIATFGWILPWFRGGEVMALLERPKETTTE